MSHGMGIPRIGCIVVILYKTLLRKKIIKIKPVAALECGLHPVITREHREISLKCQQIVSRVIAVDPTIAFLGAVEPGAVVLLTAERKLHRSDCCCCQLVFPGHGIQPGQQCGSQHIGIVDLRLILWCV